MLRLDSAIIILILTSMQCSSFAYSKEPLPVLKYNNPGLLVDLHVGLWAFPVPCDFDHDGDNDLLVSCPDVPMGGTFFFENITGNVPRPIFKPPVKVGPPFQELTPSYATNGKVRLLSRNLEVLDIKPGGFLMTRKIYPSARIHRPKKEYLVRANQWQMLDFDDDGDEDLIVGIGDWEEYGMEWARKGWVAAFDDQGEWKRGPLRGYVYLIRNEGTQQAPKYSEPVKLTAGGKVIDVYGRPAPSFADFDGDGDIDLICGEFLDGFTYFQNIGDRQKPVFAAGQRLTRDGKPIKMDLEMIVPVAFDWDKDGDYDLIVGEEDSRLALLENTGEIDENGQPIFELPYYFQQEADDVNFGALVTPVSFDWDGDGDEDIISGNTAGYIGFIENIQDGPQPKWAAPVKLKADLKPIRIMAGPNGSCQGPSEAKWGYTTLSVADWDQDGLPDLIVNSVWGKVVWYENVGTRTKPVLTESRPIEVEWPDEPPKPASYWWKPQGHELVTQWRTTPCVLDWDGDGLLDLVMMDHEGYLAFFQRTRDSAGLHLLPGKRIFHTDGPSVFDQRHEVQVEESGLLQINNGVAGRGGRVKLHFVDWDGDGHLDLLASSTNVNWMKGHPGQNGTYVLKEMGPLSDQVLAGHTTSPTTVDWDRNGVPDLLIGAEDGRFYLRMNERAPSGH